MIQVLDLPCDPEASGHLHGTILAPHIRANVVFYRSQLLALGMSMEAVSELANAWLKSIRSNDPEYSAEMDAIAASSGVTSVELAIICGRYELVNAATVASRAPLIDGCTSIAVRDSRSANGHFLLAQNWDWLVGVKGRIAVLRQRGKPGCPDTVAMTEAGIPVGKIGFNSERLGLVVNGLAIQKEDAPCSLGALPFHPRCARILRQSRFDRAIGIAISPPHPGAAYYMIAQSGGEIIGLEAWSGGYRALYDSEGLLTHANHFEGSDPPSSILELNGPHSLFRAVRLRRLVCVDEKSVTVDRLRAALSDHFAYPASLCRHEDNHAPLNRRLFTACTVIMDLDAGEMLISDGPACEGKFQKVGLQ